MHDNDTKFILAVCVGAAVFFLVLIRLLNQAEWISRSAQIEQLRTDAKRVQAKMAEDVAGQVAAINQDIASHQRWRKTVFRYFLPSGWDGVERIEMPSVASE